jgi:hypothetical protein
VTVGDRDVILRAVGTYRRGLLGGVVAVLSAFGMAGTASATTGPDALSRPPTFNVTAAQAKPFLGTYSLTHGRGKIISSTIKNAYNGYGYLQGNISVYEYFQGRPTSFVATLYEYRYRSGQMRADLWSPDLGSALLGRVTLRPVAGALAGTLQLMGDAYAVAYRKASPRAVSSAYTKAGVAAGAEADGSSDSELGGTSGLFSTAVLLGQIVG